MSDAGRQQGRGERGGCLERQILGSAKIEKLRRKISKTTTVTNIKKFGHKSSRRALFTKVYSIY